MSFKALRNWKTTALGVAALLTALVGFANGEPISMEKISMLLAGMGLVNAKDGSTGSDPSDG